MIKTKNSVFIATSLDGFIADKDGKIDWLHSILNPEQNDMGYSEFMSGIDAIIMGRNTFETVAGFDMEWPYQKPVFVLSRTLTTLPEKCQGKVQLVQGTPQEVLKQIHLKGHHKLYVDGGMAIHGFLKEDLIDEIIITVIPVILGGGVPLFKEMNSSLNFTCTSTQLFLGKVAQCHYKRNRT